MDVFASKKRSEVMSRIRGRDTKPELALRSCRLNSKIQNQKLSFVYSSAYSLKFISVLIHNHSIRKNIHGHDVFLQSHRILEIPRAIDELLQTRHHGIGNLQLCFPLGGEQNRFPRTITHQRNGAIA